METDKARRDSGKGKDEEERMLKRVEHGSSKADFSFRLICVYLRSSAVSSSFLRARKWRKALRAMALTLAIYAC
jgi:hypothetical protein